MGCICSGTEILSKQKKGIHVESVKDNIVQNHVPSVQNNNHASEQRDNISSNVNNVLNHSSSSFNSENSNSNNNNNIQSNNNQNNPRNNTRNTQAVPQNQELPQNNNVNQVLPVQQVQQRSSQSSQSSELNHQVIFQPNYEPYLQSKNDPTFNMQELPSVYVGHGLKKMNGYICNIEKEELDKRRRDFWTSRFEGNRETWELLNNFCIGDFSNKDLKELLQASELKPYSGCINVIFDAKGNIYEIPNYCIHNPSEWDIQKLKIKQPTETKLTLIIRCVLEEYVISISNISGIKTLKEGLVKNFKINKNEQGTINTERIRLFHHGKELKNNDSLYMYEIANKSIIQMMVKSESTQNL